MNVFGTEIMFFVEPGSVVARSSLNLSTANAELGSPSYSKFSFFVLYCTGYLILKYLPTTLALRIIGYSFNILEAVLDFITT